MDVNAAVRGLVAGLAGTTAMSAALWVEGIRRGGEGEIVDYDASPHVVIAASKVIGFTPSSERGRKALFLLVHWGYGSAVAIAYPPIRNRVGSDGRGAAAFFVACQAMAWTLFPVLGETPPPWRWSPRLAASSLAAHGLYAATVAEVDARLARRRSLNDRADSPSSDGAVETR